MAKPLEKGDPATVLLYLDHLRAVRGHVVSVTPVDIVFVDVSAGPYVRIELPEGVTQRRLDREGASWVRGHHHPNSPEIRALLATAALERTP